MPDQDNAVAMLQQHVATEVGKAVVGQPELLSQCTVALLCRGHVLLEGVPGLAKTLVVKVLARLLQLDYQRVQATPDLMPADILGGNVANLANGTFSLRRGPIFTDLLLVDEINRMPPRTQAALLEAMEERQVTIEGELHPLRDQFLVFATQNPVEFEGTFPLPEAQLDRFLLRVSFGYPTKDEEWQVLQRRVARRSEEIVLDKVLDPAGLLALQQVVEAIEIEESVGRYCVELVEATRSHQHLLVGSSPRGALALLLVARAFALINHRDFVTPDDVKAVALAALAHRVTLRPEMWMRNLSPTDVIQGVLDSIPVPSSSDERTRTFSAGRH